MPLLKIITVPDPLLKQKAQVIENITDDIRQQAADMIETMYAAPGIGLAANQVGILNRMFVMDTNFREDKTSRAAIVMINPAIVWTSDEPSAMEEGCLSIPGIFAEIERPRSVRVKYIDLYGETRETLADDLVSHCIQHELDHLDGVLFVDHLSRLKRSMLLKRYKKQQDEEEIF